MSNERPTYIGYKVDGLGFDAHLTLHYLGNKLTDHNFDKERRKMLILLGTFRQEAEAIRGPIAMFGLDNSIPVVKVYVPDYVYHMKELLEKNIPSPSSFGFNPHITLKMPPNETLRIPAKMRMRSLGLY